MQVIVNGTEMAIPEECTITRLLEHLALKGRLAVEVNGMIVPRSEYASYSLKPDDRIEVVHAIGGGGMGPGFIERRE